MAGVVFSMADVVLSVAGVVFGGKQAGPRVPQGDNVYLYIYIYIYIYIGEEYKPFLSGVFSRRGIYFQGFDFLRWKIPALSVCCSLPSGNPLSGF